MGKHKKESFFWTSYSDLMTSLFFVMLVLFILVIVLLHNKVRATEDELNQIRKLNASVENIDSNFFKYDQQFKRHTLKNIEVSFNTGSSNINDIPLDKQKELINAGKAINKFINNAVDSIPNAKYLLIIEGQSSKDNYNKDIFQNNYVLSYQRALELVKLWSRSNVIFADSVCEVIISGSGQSSSFRISPDTYNNKANQRFVIHIIPKPGIFNPNKKN